MSYFSTFKSLQLNEIVIYDFGFNMHFLIYSDLAVWNIFFLSFPYGNQNNSYHFFTSRDIIK